MRIVPSTNRTLIKLHGYEGKNYMLCFDNREMKDIYKTLLYRGMEVPLKLTVYRYDMKEKSYSTPDCTYYDSKKCEDEITVAFRKEEDVEEFLHTMREIKEGNVRFENTYMYQKHHESVLKKVEERKYIENEMDKLQIKLDKFKL